MQDKSNMTYQELVKGYRAKGCKLRYYGKVKEGQRTYRLYKFVIEPRYKKTLLITTGFHGEEFNGPISLLEIYDELIAYAKTMRVRIVGYICVNPDGFDKRQRYNSSDESKKNGNNDFMRYVTKNGRRVGILKKDQPYFATLSVESSAKEVRVLQKDIRSNYIFPVPHGVLDIHQQQGHLNTGEIFAYIFDRRPTYRRIMKKLEKVAKIARNDPTYTFDGGRKIFYRIDEDGFVFLHDGTIIDMFYRFGSKYVVTSETKTTLPLEKVAAINLIWIKELIKLIVKK